MSGLSRHLPEPSPACARRRRGFLLEVAPMKRISRQRPAKRRHHGLGIGLSGMVLVLSICAGPGLISAAGAQTIGSFYTSTAPKDCRVSGAGNGVDDSTTRFCPG